MLEHRTDDVEDQPTCGQGLAEYSTLPAKLADLTDALGATLEAHLESLDPADESARREHAAYSELSARYRKIAAELAEAAHRMIGYRELPVVAHDEKALLGTRSFECFDRFVKLESELVDLLVTRAEVDQQRLAELLAARANARRA